MNKTKEEMLKDMAAAEAMINMMDDPFGFSKAVNDEGIARLNDEELKQVGDILKKAGY